MNRADIARTCTSAATLAACHRALVEGRGGSVRLEHPPAHAGKSESAERNRSDQQAKSIAGSVTTVAEAVAVRRGAEPALIERRGIAARWPPLSRGAAHFGDSRAPRRKTVDVCAGAGDEAIGRTFCSARRANDRLFRRVRERRRRDAFHRRQHSPARRSKRRAPSEIGSRRDPKTSSRLGANVLQSAHVTARDRGVELTPDVSSLLGGSLALLALAWRPEELRFSIPAGCGINEPQRDRQKHAGEAQHSAPTRKGPNGRRRNPDGIARRSSRDREQALNNRVHTEHQKSPASNPAVEARSSEGPWQEQELLPRYGMKESTPTAIGSAKGTPMQSSYPNRIQELPRWP